MNLTTLFKIHSFIYWGSISVVLNFSVQFITKYGEVTQDQTGLLFGATPLLLMFAKPLFCSFADKWVVHDLVLLGSIISVLAFYGLYMILPFVPDKQLVWWLFCVLKCFGHIAQGVLTSISDSLTLKVVEIEGSNFGQIRLWGSLGWAVLSLLAGWLNNLDTLPRYMPGLLLFTTLNLIDFVLVLVYLKKIREGILKPSYYKNHIPTISESVQEGNRHMGGNKKGLKLEVLKYKPEKKPICKLVLLTFYRHPNLVKHVFICVVVGILTGLQWNYFPMYLENVLTDGDASLVGYAELVQSLPGEIPFFYFAGHIVELIGLNGSISLVLFAFSIRNLLYTFFTPSTAYYILFLGLLNGVTFGLFYCAMNILSSDYSKKMAKVELEYRKECLKSNEKNEKLEAELSEDDSAFATMQSVLSGAYEGVGVGLGSLLSGVMIQHLGWLALFIWPVDFHSSFSWPILFSLSLPISERELAANKSRKRCLKQISNNQIKLDKDYCDE